MVFNTKDFYRYLHASRSGGFQCAYCNHSQYSVLMEDTKEGYGPGQFRLSPADSTGYHAFYGALCQKCGHTHFFFCKTVDRWVRDNPA